MEEYILEKSEYIAEEIEKYDYTTFSTCDHYNWNKKDWVFQDEIVNNLIKRGYSVNKNIKFGVTDYLIKKKI